MISTKDRLGDVLNYSLMPSHRERERYIFGLHTVGMRLVPRCLVLLLCKFRGIFGNVSPRSFDSGQAKFFPKTFSMSLWILLLLLVLSRSQMQMNEEQVPSPMLIRRFFCVWP